MFFDQAEGMRVEQPSYLLCHKGSVKQKLFGKATAGNLHLLHRSAAYHWERASFAKLGSDEHHSADNSESWAWLTHSHFQVMSWVSLYIHFGSHSKNTLSLSKATLHECLSQLKER